MFAVAVCVAKSKSQRHSEGHCQRRIAAVIQAKGAPTKYRVLYMLILSVGQDF